MKKWCRPVYVCLDSYNRIKTGGIYVMGSEGVSDPSNFFVSNGTTCDTIGAIFNPTNTTMYPSSVIFANSMVDAGMMAASQADLGTFSLISACS